MPNVVKIKLFYFIFKDFGRRERRFELRRGRRRRRRGVGDQRARGRKSQKPEIGKKKS